MPFCGAVHTCSW